MGAGGTGGEPDRVVLFDQFRPGQTDAAFFRSPVLFAVLKQGIVTKRFIKQRFDQSRASRRPPHQAFHFQLRKIPAHTRWRGVQFLDQFGQRDAPLTPQLAQNPFDAFVPAQFRFLDQLSHQTGDAAREQRAARSLRNARVYTARVGEAQALIFNQKDDRF